MKVLIMIISLISVTVGCTTTPEQIVNSVSEQSQSSISPPYSNRERLSTIVNHGEKLVEAKMRGDHETASREKTIVLRAMHSQ